MSVAPAVRDNYVAIIDAILAVSDLTKISEKKIRAGIQEKVEYDITPQKVTCSLLQFSRLRGITNDVVGRDQGADHGAVRYFQRPNERTVSSSHIGGSPAAALAYQWSL
jgi:hypothetical protein